jgi:hypothetical protein
MTAGICLTCFCIGLFLLSSLSHQHLCPVAQLSRLDDCFAYSLLHMSRRLWCLFWMDLLLSSAGRSAVATMSYTSRHVEWR